MTSKHTSIHLTNRNFFKKKKYVSNVLVDGEGKFEHILKREWLKYEL